MRKAEQDDAVKSVCGSRADTRSCRLKEVLPLAHLDRLLVRVGVVARPEVDGLGLGIRSLNPELPRSNRRPVSTAQLPEHRAVDGKELAAAVGGGCDPSEGSASPTSTRAARTRRPGGPSRCTRCQARVDNVRAGDGDRLARVRRERDKVAGCAARAGPDGLPVRAGPDQDGVARAKLARLVRPADRLPRPGLGSRIRIAAAVLVDPVEGALTREDRLCGAARPGCAVVEPAGPTVSVKVLSRGGRGEAGECAREKENGRPE